MPTKTLQTVRDLDADPQNANRGTVRGRAFLETSVRRYGFGRSVLADKNGRIIAGNKTVAAASAIGENPNVIVVPSTGRDLVVVQRTDLDLSTDAKAKELAIADNRGGEVGLEWNVTMLQSLEAQGVDLKQFWRTEEFDQLAKDGADKIDPATEVPGMALQPFEEYNYLMVVFKNSQDWQGIIDRLAIRRESVVLGGALKVGLGRVVDGAALLRELCRSSSRVVNGSIPSEPTPSRSSRTRPSASRKVKPRRIAK